MEDYLLSFYLHHHIYIRIERNNILGNIQKKYFYFSNNLQKIIREILN